MIWIWPGYQVQCYKWNQQKYGLTRRSEDCDLVGGVLVGQMDLQDRTWLLEDVCKKGKDKKKVNQIS